MQDFDQEGEPCQAPGQSQELHHAKSQKRRHPKCLRLEYQPALADEGIRDRQQVCKHTNQQVMKVVVEAQVNETKCQVREQGIPSTDRQVPQPTVIAPNVTQHGTFASHWANSGLVRPQGSLAPFRSPVDAYALACESRRYIPRGRPRKRAARRPGKIRQ
jgi:hypothetical protein